MNILYSLSVFLFYFDTVKVKVYRNRPRWPKMFRVG